MTRKNSIRLIGCILLIIINTSFVYSADFDDRIQRMRSRINEIENFIEEDPTDGTYKGKSGSHVLFKESKNDLFVKEIRSIGFAGMDDGELLSPKGVIMIDGLLYIADSDNARIQIMTEEGKHIKSFSDASKDGFLTLKKPIDITYVNDKVYIVDKKLDKIYVYSKEGDFVDSFGSFESARSIASDKQGNLYVCDGIKKAVYVYDKTGRNIKKIDQIDKLNKMYMPIDVEISKAGHIYVLDKSRRSIIEYDSNFSFIQETRLSDYTKWVRSLEVDSSGYVYVVTDDPSIIVFDSRLNIVGKIKNNIYKPDVIYVENNRMYVSDFRKHSIYIYELYM